MKSKYDYMWIQYNGNIDVRSYKAEYKFMRFGNEPEFPAEGQLNYYTTFVLRLFYEK